MTEVRSWADDEMLKPWRRGRLTLPFTTSERTAEEQGRRLLGFIAGTAVTAFVIIFALLVFFGMVPEIHADPKVYWVGPRDPWVPLKLSGGAAAIGAVAFAVIAGPLAGSAPRSLGHPWTFSATEDGLTLTTSDGETHAGRWADWSLAAYDWAPIVKGAPVITELVLALGGQELRVRLLSLRHQQKFLRVVTQKIAV